MEKYHYDLTLHKHNELHTIDRLNSGIFLCVLHANKIPPHIGLICNGLFYSAKVNGKDERVPLNSLFQIITKREVKTLFFELVNDISSELEIQDYFSRFPSQLMNEQTCLTPLISILKSPDYVSHIGDLLKYLEYSELILARLTLHLPREFKGIPFYTVQDINKRIALLKNDKRQKNLPQTNGAI